MSDDRAIQLLKQCGAIYDGHVVFTKKEIPPGSGKWEYFHGDRYVNKDVAYLFPQTLYRLAYMTAQRLVGKKIDVILGIEKGAIAIAPMTAVALTALQYNILLPDWGEVASCFAEKDGEEKMVIKRVFREFLLAKPGLNVWITEDIGNSGSSARKCVRAVRELNQNPIGVSFLVVRKIITADEMDGVPVDWLTLVEGNMWPEDECLKCKEEGIESVSQTVGKGEDFLRRKGIIK